MVTCTEAMNETYMDVRKLISHTVKQFQKRYPGGKYDELLCEANYSYVNAYHSYKPEKGSFTTWIRFCIWTGLLDHRRREARLAARKIDLFEVVLQPKILFTEFVEELSEDARTIARLVIEEPYCLGEKVNKSAIRRYLRSIGWTTNRIRESFLVLQKVLQ